MNGSQDRQSNAMKQQRRILTWMICIPLLGSCLDQKPERWPESYQSKPNKFNMPASLLEISGITFGPDNSDTIYAINDEEGKLYRIRWDDGAKRQLHAKFAKKGDYEDLAIWNGNVYVLKSNGELFWFPFDEAVEPEIEDTKEIKGLLPKGEYESMAVDPVSNELLVMCKNCKTDNGEDQTSVYRLHVSDTIYVNNTFSINLDAVETKSDKVKRGFRPSAMTYNPMLKQWFVLSAVNKSLVTFDHNWKPLDLYTLSTNLFEQPEGIAFDKAGNLYISNEGDDISDGNIIQFKYKTPATKSDK
jgi:uncharacterized protein YjiK